MRPWPGSGWHAGPPALPAPPRICPADTAVPGCLLRCMMGRVMEWQVCGRLVGPGVHWYVRMSMLFTPCWLAAGVMLAQACAGLQGGVPDAPGGPARYSSGMDASAPHFTAFVCAMGGPCAGAPLHR